MAVRSEIRRFVDLGPLPPETDDDEAGDEAFEELERALVAVPKPVSDDEAELLAASFGPDECFGLAWTLLHLIESSPTPVPATEPAATANVWLRTLWRRQHHPAPGA